MRRELEARLKRSGHPVRAHRTLQDAWAEQNPESPLHWKDVPKTAEFADRRAATEQLFKESKTKHNAEILVWTEKEPELAAELVEHNKKKRPATGATSRNREEDEETGAANGSPFRGEHSGLPGPQEAARAFAGARAERDEIDADVAVFMRDVDEVNATIRKMNARARDLVVRNEASRKAFNKSAHACTAAVRVSEELKRARELRASEYEEE